MTDTSWPSDPWVVRPGPREGLGYYVQVVRGRLKLIVACILVATAAAAAYAKLAPKTWEAESHLLITPVNSETSLMGLGLLTTSSDVTGDVSTAASFVTTPEVGSLVAKRVGGITPREALTSVSAVPVAQSNVIAITASASTAARARKLANAFAEETVSHRTELLHQRINQLLPAVRSQVEALPSASRSGPGSLGERLASLETLRTAPDPTITLQSLASLPEAPSSPRTKISIIAGILVGLVIGIGVAFAQEGLDPRIHHEERLRQLFKLPVLARIPRERGRLPGLPLRPSDLSPAAQEAYRMLRVGLGIGTSAQAARSIMVTGSTRGEGKSTTALNLATAIAATGLRVLLVEADLLRPRLSAALGVQPPHGVIDVLLGDVTLEDATVTVDWLSDRLNVLLATHPEAPIGGGLGIAMDRIIAEAEDSADIVIFDAPPVTEVSDALPLSRGVDAVLIVARLGHSRADQMVNLGETLARQHVRPVGMVIVGEDITQGGYYQHRRRTVLRPRRDRAARARV